jgi:Flp pilus assembly protein TadD
MVWNGKAVTLLDLQRHDEALEAFEQALQCDPKYALAWNNMALTLDLLGLARQNRHAKRGAARSADESSQTRTVAAGVREWRLKPRLWAARGRHEVRLVNSQGLIAAHVR